MNDDGIFPAPPSDSAEMVGSKLVGNLREVVHTTKPTLTIIRGLPGSGKSTLGQKLVESSWDMEPSVSTVLFEADQFMLWDAEYEEIADNVDVELYPFYYSWKPELIPIAHALCLNSTKLYLLRGVSVVVANTFTTKKEMQPYLDFCEANGFPVKIEVCTGNYGSVHNVPQETLARMAARWED